MMCFDLGYGQLQENYSDTMCQLESNTVGREVLAY